MLVSGRVSLRSAYLPSRGPRMPAIVTNGRLIGCDSQRPKNGSCHPGGDWNPRWGVDLRYTHPRGSIYIYGILYLHSVDLYDLNVGKYIGPKCMLYLPLCHIPQFFSIGLPNQPFSRGVAPFWCQRKWLRVSNGGKHNMLTSFVRTTSESKKMGNWLLLAAALAWGALLFGCLFWEDMLT